MNWLKRLLPVGFSVLMFGAIPMPGAEQDKVNPGAQTLSDFSKRVADYMKVRQSAQSHVPALKPSNSPEVIKHHEHSLAHEIREARRGAAKGNLFTPEITQEFRRLLVIAMQGPEAQKIRQSLDHAEPVRTRPLAVNEDYPPGTPLQSTPPSLLLNLPPLPKELEYRIVGRDLILRDAEANLIVDFIVNAIS